jgi:cytochrome c biogenesis protein CcmG/thiol:disulfide interchange protein DsbE
MRRLLQAAAILLLVGLVALFAKSLRDSAGTVAAAVRDGQEPAAPDFTRDRLIGDGTVSLRDYRGRVVLLNFWASWCVPCQDETPLFVDYAARYRDRGLAVIGVNAQDFVGDARASQSGSTSPIRSCTTAGTRSPAGGAAAGSPSRS